MFVRLLSSACDTRGRLAQTLTGLTETASGRGLDRTFRTRLRRARKRVRHVSRIIRSRSGLGVGHVGYITVRNLVRRTGRIVRDARGGRIHSTTLVTTTRGIRRCRVTDCKALTALTRRLNCHGTTGLLGRALRRRGTASVGLASLTLGGMGGGTRGGT